MIGSSPALLGVLRKVAIVAPTDVTVLIYGETGTGKELIARALCAQSLRRNRPLISLNCCAISAGLVESELFGHVKGAFTGAANHREGRFQVAHGGTLFLDEVSGLSLEAQAKLLRVLQEHEFEAVGSSKTVTVDVRIIAATNRELGLEVQAGRFRADLFYRLNTFPIVLPALRERREDIPALAEHFMRGMARKLGKPLEGISSATLAALSAYSWPGNVRELQNLIERAAVLATDRTLLVDWDLGSGDYLPASQSGRDPAQSATPACASAPLDLREVQTLEALERSHIVAVLKGTRGVIEGSGGAARLLDIKPSTMRHRLKKLGIRRDLVSSELTVECHAQPMLNRTRHTTGNFSAPAPTP
jgi:formate hydrogenlyase transcriptional activator